MFVHIINLVLSTSCEVQLKFTRSSHFLHVLRKIILMFCPIFIPLLSYQSDTMSWISLVCPWECQIPIFEIHFDGTRGIPWFNRCPELFPCTLSLWYCRQSNKQQDSICHAWWGNYIVGGDISHLNLSIK